MSLSKIAVRGEMIVSKENFKKYNEIKKSRNMSSGIVNRKEQIDNLYEYNEFMLEEWYENYKDKNNEMIKSFERYLKYKEDDEAINHIKQDILFMLYNNRLIENK